jgi:hypothetical protein
MAPPLWLKVVKEEPRFVSAAVLDEGGDGDANRHSFFVAFLQHAFVIYRLPIHAQ